MITNEELYALWAKEESPWSTWAKPVLFATMNDNDMNVSPLQFIPNASWAPPFNYSIAIILDLPGEESVLTGLSLARSGYQPVPLYNCCKAPGMLVDVTSIVATLAAGGELLSTINLPPYAPPAFLLDSNRLNNSDLRIPGYFDNRWCVVPQDMPSATFLKKKGIQTIILRSAYLKEDLSHILFRYQQEGLKIEISHPLKLDILPINVSRPSLFKSLFYRWQVLLDLRRNSSGGFGAIIPEPSSAGG